MRREVRKVIDRMRAKEREMWRPSQKDAPAKIGRFAVGHMLDGFASDLEVAIGDQPPRRLEQERCFRSPRWWWNYLNPFRSAK